MPEVSTLHRQGDLVHPELVCGDLDATCEFYTPLLGWDYVPGVVGPHYIATVAGVECAGLAHTVTRMDGVPSGWGPYLAVDDLEATCKTITENGGTVVQAPRDIGNVGRIAFAADPAGAVFGVWRAGPVSGVHMIGEPGTVCMAELVTPDPVGALRFYGAVLGYEPSPGYLTRGNGALDVMVSEQTPAPPRDICRWLVYLGITDVAVASERAEAGGGDVVEPPCNRWGKRVAVLRDPHGAVFGIAEIGGEHGGDD